MFLRFSLFAGLVLASLPGYPHHSGSCLQHDVGDSSRFSSAVVSVDSLKTQFEKYITSLTSVPLKMNKVRKTLKHQLDGAQNDARTYGFLTHLADSLLYRSDSPYRNDALYEMVVRHELSVSYFSEVEKERLRFRLGQILSNRVGCYAKDFSFVTRNGQQRKLSELSKDADWLVIFFDPDCMQCQIFVSSLRSNHIINDRIQRGLLHILAVDTDPDMPLWERIKNDLPASWMVVRDGGAIRDAGLYDLRVYPAVYLLNKHRKVVLKNADLSDLLDKWRQ